MKKLLLTQLVFVAFHFVSNAQNTTFGFTAGAVIANYKFKMADVSFSQKSKIGITAGVLANIPFNKQFSIQPAVNFVQKGTKIENTDGTFTDKSTTTVNCIEVPLNFLYNVSGKNGGNFFIGAGPSIVFAISGKDKYDDGTNVTSDKLKFGNGEDDDLKGMDLGANFITGYNFKNGFLFSVNYNLGLSNLVPGESSSDYSAKSSYFGLKLGYVLNSRGHN